MGAGGYSYLEENQWETLFSYRYLHSERIFVGTDHRPDLERGSPILDVHSIDLGATYGITKRFSSSLTVPILTSHIDSATGQGDGMRHSGTASGIGDLRLTGNAWVFDPDRSPEGNLGLSLGVKAPTGDERTTTYFYKANGTRELRATDISG